MKMKDLNFGMIGREERVEALAELNAHSYYKDMNLWIEKPHTGSYVRGQWFKDYDELLGDCDFYDTFKSFEEYEDFMEEYEIDEDPRIVALLKQGKTAHYEASRDQVSDDRVEIIKNLIEDGRGDTYYTYQEAVQNIMSDYPDEALIIWLLQR